MLRDFRSHIKYSLIFCVFTPDGQWASWHIIQYGPGWQPERLQPEPERRRFVARQQLG